MINHPFYEFFYEKLKKLSKKLITFSFFYKTHFLKWFTNIVLKTYISKTLNKYLNYTYIIIVDISAFKSHIIKFELKLLIFQTSKSDAN